MKQPFLSSSTETTLLDLDPDTVIEELYGTGRYQLQALICLGGIFVGAFPAVQGQVFAAPRLVSDPRYPAFTPEAVDECQTMIFVGYAVGSLVAGPFMDYWGRWAPTYGLATGLVVANACAAAAPASGSVRLYGHCLFGLGFCIPCVNNAYVYMQEFMPDWLRSPATVSVNVFFSIGVAAMALVSGSITQYWDWRLEALLWFVPLSLVCPVGLATMQESLLFLLAKGRLREASMVANAIARTNGAPLPGKACSTPLPRPEEATPTEEENSPLRLLCAPPLLLRTLMSLVAWTGSSLAFFGLLFSAGKLSDDIHMNVLLFALTDIVAYFISAVLVSRAGTRVTQALAFLGAAVSLVACGGLRPGSSALMACAIVGKLFVDITLTTTYQLTSEIFPTECRSSAFGVCNAVARLASLLAPLSRSLPTSISCPLFGMVCLLACFATMTLPDPQQPECGARQGRVGSKDGVSDDGLVCD